MANSWMLKGIFNATMDAKGRISMPTRFREELNAASESELVATVDSEERCVLLYPKLEWQKVHENLSALPNVQTEGNKRNRWLQRIMISYATDLKLDGNGRIRLPPPLRDHCGLHKALVVVGQGNKFEIWAQETWKERVDAFFSQDNDTVPAEWDAVVGLSI